MSVDVGVVFLGLEHLGFPENRPHELAVNNCVAKNCVLLGTVFRY
jgi:hypothetical protein